MTEYEAVKFWVDWEAEYLYLRTNRDSIVMIPFEAWKEINETISRHIDQALDA